MLPDTLPDPAAFVPPADAPAEAPPDAPADAPPEADDELVPGLADGLTECFGLPEGEAECVGLAALWPPLAQSTALGAAAGITAGVVDGLAPTVDEEPADAVALPEASVAEGLLLVVLVVVELAPGAGLLAAPVLLAGAAGLVAVADELAGLAELAEPPELPGAGQVAAAAGCRLAVVPARPLLLLAAAATGFCPDVPGPAAAPGPLPPELCPDSTEELSWTIACRSGGTAMATPRAKTMQATASAGRSMTSRMSQVDRQPARSDHPDQRDRRDRRDLRDRSDRDPAANGCDGPGRDGVGREDAGPDGARPGPAGTPSSKPWLASVPAFANAGPPDRILVRIRSSPSGRGSTCSAAACSAARTYSAKSWGGPFLTVLLLLQRGFERLHAAGCVALDRATADAHAGRDLGFGQIKVVAQHNSLALPLR